ncbi:hypothetical protein LTR36_005564 [Oleoguttula mirabilis]|uniref:G-patch domain-containing protein n=1 Tax=Oleoguttula mirabilis TaxID=1507867 RepID=A0AAV9JF37_9PEZI|nr:hypothetical protein LTR36_005564 [Oleoguttula mirabilis]
MAGDTYRPARRSPPDDRYRSGRYQDSDRPTRGAYRDHERDHAFNSDLYDDRRYSSRSPRKGLDYDDEDGFRIRGREAQTHSRGDASYADTEVGYYDDGYTYSDALRSDQEARPPPAKRPYRGGERYEELYYEELPEVDLSYRGENDVSEKGPAWRLLLVRNLKESLTEDLFAKGLEKLHRGEDSPTGAPEGSLRRVIIVRDRETDKSMTFGFAEYHNVESAIAALAKADELGDKCTIASKVVQVSFPHLTVFPRADFGVAETSEKFTVFMPNSGARHKYHDARYYPSELMISEEAPRGPSTPPKETGSGGVRTLQSKEKSKKRKAPGTTAPTHLQHWQNKAAELRSQEEKVAAEKDKERASKKAQPPASGVNAISATPPPTTVESSQQTFCIDTPQRKCCYLCAGKFPTSEALQRHLKESAKHAANLENPATTQTAFEKLGKAGVSEGATVKLLVVVPSLPKKKVSGDSSSAAEQAAMDLQYRDRAAERRKEEAQTGGTKPANVSFSLKGGVGGNKGKSKSTSAPATAEAGQQPAHKPSYGKGMGMLQKAGWSEGQGLGAADGTMGRAAPIEQMVYARGVGLGHEGGKRGEAVEEAARMTKGGGGEGFLEMTKAGARSRYDKMASS